MFVLTTKRFSHFFVLSMIVLLAGCATSSDPSKDASLYSTMKGVWGGGYDDHIEKRQQELDRMKATAAASRSKQQTLEQKKAQRERELAEAERKLAKLERDLASAERTIVRSRDQLAHSERERNLVKGQMKKIDSQIKQLEADVAANKSTNMAQQRKRKKLKAQYDKLQEILFASLGGSL